ncbi:MAG: hypothetical protein WBQ14_09005 [Gaiellaceae bacterium]
MSATSEGRRQALRARLMGPRARAGLFALSVACVVGLVLLKATAADAGPLSGLLKLILPFAFVGLSIVDFRASVAIAVFELVLGGTSGSWITYAPHLSGRILLDGVVMLRAVSIVIAGWRRGERKVLGRYGAHALALAVLIPAIWMTIGLLNHNGASNVFGDGNGFVYFAFAVAIVILVRGGSGRWFRNVFFAACATNGVAYLLLILASASHLTTLGSIRTALLYGRLDMGGIIGHMTNGDFRLFTGASLYLQIGLALTTWRLLARPRSYWYWLLYGVFWVDLVATYTRGLWIGGVAAVVLVVALAAPTLKRALSFSGVTIAGFAVALAVLPLAGVSLSDYVLKRAESITSTSEFQYPTAIVNPSFERGGDWVLFDWTTPSLRMRRVTSEHTSGSHALELIDTAAGEDDYVYQDLSVLPNKRYTVSAWVDSRSTLPTRLVAWDVQGGSSFEIGAGAAGETWQRVELSFTTSAQARDVQIRLYAAVGRVFWDDIHFAPAVDAPPATTTASAASPPPTTTTASAASPPPTTATPSASESSPGAKSPSTTPKTPSQVAPQPRINMTPSDTRSADLEGDLSNAYRIKQARILFRHIRKRPLLGSGFGAIATDYSPVGYRYELSYLDILFKAGIVGLLLFLSFPLRLVWDALRLRFGRAAKAREVTQRGGAVVVAVIGSVMLVASTNPYLFAAFGFFPILAMVAWLELAPEPGEQPPSR